MERIKINIQKFAAEPTIKFAADVSKAQENIKKLITTIDGLKTKLQASNIAYGTNSKSIEILDDRNKILNKTLSAQRKLLRNLKIAFEAQTDQDAKGAKQKEKLANQINKVKDAIELTKAKIIKNNTAMEKMGEQTAETTEKTVTFKNVVSQLKDVLSSLNIKYIINMIKRLGTALYTDFISKAIDTSEELNLFNVVFDNISENGKKTFSDLGKEATSFQNKLNEAFGTNIKETMRYQGLFQAMGESAGLDDKTAAIMSENMTKLAYDLASLYNTTETKAAESLRAGVYAGQTKPLRNYGIDVTQTSYKPLMEELGMTKTVSELTQAEKEILRYISTLKQAKNAMGDFANTIESPANQLKVLRQQFYEMQTAIGNLFVGAFARILPYVNAIIMVIKEVARAIAGFFGIEMSDFNTGLAYYEDDLEDYSESLDDVGGSASGASDNIKELKRQVLGFDQINNLTTPTPSSSSGGGGGGGAGIVGGIDDKLLAAIKGYENGMDKVRMKANEIRDQMMKILGFTQDINGEWEWGGFSVFFKNFTEWFGDLDFKGKALTIVGVITALSGLISLIKSFGKITGLTSLFSSIGTALAGGEAAAAGGTAAGGVAAGGAAAGGISAGGYTAIVIAGIVGAISEMVVLNDIFDKFIGKFNDFMDGKNVSFDWLDAFYVATLKTMTILPLGKELVLTFGGIKVAIDALSPAVKGMQEFSPATIVAGVQILDEETGKLKPISEETARRLGEVLNAYGDFTTNLNAIYMLNKAKLESGETIFMVDDAAVEALTNRLNIATDITKTKLNEQKDTALKTLESMKNDLGGHYESILESVNDHYQSEEETINKKQQEIIDIINTGYTERGYITKEEMGKINQIKTEMEEQAIDQLSDSEAEALAIKQEMAEHAKELAIGQASEILKRSAEVRDKTIEDAKTQYDNVCKEAEKLKAAGAINEEQYKLMREAAKDTYDETVQNAKNQHQEIYDEFAKQNEEIAKYIDEDTGEVIPKWKKWLMGIEDKWNETWGNVKANIFGEIVPDMENAGEELSKAVQEGIDNAPDPNVDVTTDSASEIQSEMNSQINNVCPNPINVGVSLPSSWSLQNTLSGILSGVSGGLNLTFSKRAGGGIFVNGGWQPIQAYANGGVPTGGQLFMAREAGPELVGRIGRHTAVMNNNQIVESVKAGVYDAVSAAMSQGGMGSVQIDLHTDEGVVVDRINRVTRQTGVCPIEI